MNGSIRQPTLWASPSVRERVETALGITSVQSKDLIHSKVDVLIAVGGGTLIDEAKAWRVDNALHARLIAIPSIWGSGAECSPIAVINRPGSKEIRMGEQYLPSARVIWPELADSLNEGQIRAACGDAWSHVLEGFLSPLAGEEVRKEAAKLISEMLETPVARDPRWFELSCRACSIQSRSSVGLVHGIAHTLETTADEGKNWGHARLCSTFLFPVMQFNANASCKWAQLMDEFEVDSDAVIKTAKALFRKEEYTDRLPALEMQWPAIVRDRCSRTNSALVRLQSIEYFLGFAAS